MRDWISSLDEIDRDCIHRYEYLLGRKLKDCNEYIEIDGQVDEMILEFESRKEFYEAYPELKKYKGGFNMIQNYTPSQYRTVIEYFKVFDDGHRNGFGFPCDENGKVFDDLNPDALKNYNWCLNNPDKFVRFNKVVKESWTVRDDAHGTCQCGNEVYLYDEYYGACQCGQCGQWYNLSGQELLPPEEWQENLDDDY